MAGRPLFESPRFHGAHQAPTVRQAGPIERRGRQALCLHEAIGSGEGTGGTPTTSGTPHYYDACWEWHEHLSEDQQDFVTYVIDAFTNWGDEYAKRWAAKYRQHRGVRSEGK
jgi:hypothetical protein